MSCSDKLLDLLLSLRGVSHHELRLKHLMIGLQPRLMAGGVFEADIEQKDGRYFEFLPDGTGKRVIILVAYSSRIPSPYCLVEDPEVVDLVAVDPAAPKHWLLLRGEPGAFLNEYYVALELFKGSESNGVLMHPDPIEWLQYGCKGAVALDKVALDRLEDLPLIFVTTLSFGEYLERWFEKRGLRRPEIRVIQEMLCA